MKLLVAPGGWVKFWTRGNGTNTSPDGGQLKGLRNGENHYCGLYDAERNLKVVKHTDGLLLLTIFSADITSIRSAYLRDTKDFS